MTRLLILVLLLLPNMVFALDNNLSIGKKLELHSKILGETRTIHIHLPDNYNNGETKYPVLYLTDGPGHFKHTVGTMDFLAENGRMPQMIIVGIANTQRTRDLTPKILISDDKRFANGGGADNFVLFFEQELIPFVEQNFRTQPFRIFSGHSFGGLFAIHTFFTKPELFNAYIAVSPSLWWDEMRLVNDAKTFFKGTKSMDRTLFITMANEGERMTEPYNAFITHAKNSTIENLTLAHKEFDDEDHSSTVLRSQYFGLKSIWNGWHLSYDKYAEGLKTVKQHYANISQKFGYDVQVPEAVINNVGYRALMNEKIAEAIETFAYNVKQYPNSANVYDSLGEAQEVNGDLDKALKNYTKAVELADDNNRNKALFEKNRKRLLELTAQKTNSIGE